MGTRAALFGTTALVVSASNAHAIDYVVNTAETSTFILGLGTADTLIINGSGEITTVSPGVAVIDLADSITIQSTSVTAEIDADAVGIEVQGIGADLTGGISIALGAIVTATTNGGGSNDGTGILVRTGADISGGVNNSGAITGYDYGIKIDNSASISGGVTNSGNIYGANTAILVEAGAVSSQTLGGIINTGTIGMNAAASSTAEFGIRVSGSNSDISGLIDNDGFIVGSDSFGAGIQVDGGDISGGIENSGVIGSDATGGGGSTTAYYGIEVTGGGDISGGIVNTGTITGDHAAIAVSTGNISGGIVNSGNFGGEYRGVFVDAGILGSTSNLGIDNQSGGVISGDKAVDIGDDSTVYGITNSGTISGDDAGVSVEYTSTVVGAITNNAGATIGSTADNTRQGIEVYLGSHVTGGIINDGTIFGDNDGIVVQLGSSLGTAATGSAAAIAGIVNNSLGVISGSSTGIQITSTSYVHGGILNSGRIYGTTYALRIEDNSEVSRITNNSGGIIGKSTGGSTGNYGIYVRSGAEVAGGITNSGEIFSSFNAVWVRSATVAGGITNDGLIETGQIGINVSDGASVGAAATGTSAAIVGISNQLGGVITGGNIGILVDAATVHGGISNSGYIYGASQAIDIRSGATVAGITNTSAGIIGASTGTAGSPAGAGIFVVDAGTTVTGNINNSGAIVGANNAIYFVGDASLIGDIINNTGATIGLTTPGGPQRASRDGIAFSVGATMTGDIINSGTIYGGNDGINFETSATLSGNITNNSGGLIGVTGSGNLAGVAGIEVQGGSVVSGSISNAGTIFGSDYGIDITGSLGVGISNTGRIGVTTAGARANNDGIRITGAANTLSGGITNSGTIYGDVRGLGIGGSASVGGDITNSGLIGLTASAAMASSAGIYIQNSAGLTGSIVNSGTIVGRDYGVRILKASSFGGIQNTGLIGVTASGATAFYTGIEVTSAPAMTSGITNTGTIFGAGRAIRIRNNSSVGALTNNTSGQIGITASGASAVIGILLENGGSISTLTNNSGAIAGSDAAIQIEGGGTITTGIVNTGGGTIAGGRYGIEVTPGVTISGGISNNGLIEGRSNSAIYIDDSNVNGNITNDDRIEGGTIGIHLDEGTLAGGLTNSGTIEGGDSGVYLEDNATITGSLVNNSSGTIEGADHGIRVTTSSSVAGGIFNAGHILASTTSGTGIHIATNATSGGVTNSGTIEGDTTSVQLGNSDSTLTLQTGSNLIGGADGGTGTNDTLVLTGYGSENETFSDFENLTVSASASGIWALSANASIDAVTVNSGILDIQGAFTAASATVAGGTLSVASGGSLSLATVSGTGGNLDVAGTLTATSSVVVGGTLNVTNSGTLNALSLNVGDDADIAGDVNITNAVIVGGALNVASTGTLDALTLDVTGDADVAGTVTIISGVDVGGALSVTSTGVLTTTRIDVTGDMDVAGSVTATGDLNVGGALAVASGGILSVQDDLDVTGDLDVAGSMHVSGKATVGGMINVSSGTSLIIDDALETVDLDVDGTISFNDVIVSGTLSGAGTATGDVTVTGVLSPGNSPGTLNVVGTLIEANDSTYLVEHEVGATPETDNVVVTGAALIGTNVDVTVAVGAGTDGFVDDILTATGGISGAYDDVIGIDDNIVAIIVYPNVNTATLLVAKTDALAATTATVSDAGLVFMDNLQVGARRDGRVWATGYLYNAENEGLGQDGADFDQDAFGFNAGVDVISQPNLKVGLAVGYLDGNIDINSSTSKAENDALFGAAYLNYMNDNFYLDGAVIVGQQSIDMSRTLSAGTATASTDATSYGANLEAGFELEALGGRLSPYVKVGIHSATLDGYSEAGAAGAITVGAVETRQMRAGGGVRYAVDLGSEDGIQVTPALKMGLTQEWHDGDSSADIGFVGYTGSTTAALDFEDQTTVDLGVSFDVKLSEAVSAFVGWDAALGVETTRNTGTIGVSVNW